MARCPRLEREVAIVDKLLCRLVPSGRLVFLRILYVDLDSIYDGLLERFRLTDWYRKESYQWLREQLEARMCILVDFPGWRPGDAVSC